MTTRVRPLGPLPLSEPVRTIASRLIEAGHETWCVGGALRDHLLGQEASDVDLATSATPEVIQRLFRRTVPVGIRFGTVGVLDADGRLHEVTTFRADVVTDGRHAEVVFGVSLEEDLARRDFTINALACHPLTSEWRDPFDGYSDLVAGRIRAVGEPSHRFEEDYLRILRALRFAARLGFTIESGTWDAACAVVDGLRQLSAERVRDEWFKGLLTARRVSDLVQLWRDSGAAAIWLPELRGDFDVDPRSVGRGRDPVILTALLCDQPGDVMRRLKGSGREISRAEAMARGPAEPADATPQSVRRWLALVLETADDLMALATLREGAAPAWVDTVIEVRERGDPVSRSDLAVTGRDLAEAGIGSGPAMGRILAGLLDAVLDDPGLNTRETLLAMAHAWVAAE